MNLAVKPAPEPTVELLTLMRRKLACTPVTVRASPEALVETSRSLYSASTSAMAPCRLTLMAEGATEKSVCQRTAQPWSGMPVGCGTANCDPAVAELGTASLLKEKPASPGASEYGGSELA